jgi:CRP-like cAMP-binding protein
MFRSLSEGELRDIANRLEARQYHRNEVILWQGGLGEGVYFIKSGIVGITRLSPDRRGSRIMTYLKQGDLLGEYGLLFEQNIAATATATALSEVDVLLMKRQDVLALLKDHPNAAIELVQMLAQRLLVMDAQSQERAGQSVLCLVFGVGPEAGGTVIGTALAMKLTPITQTSVVYTEHPAPSRLAAKFGFLPETEVYSHPGGFDIFVPLGLSGVPAAVRATLVMDRLMANYTTIVVGVSGDMDGTVIYMLERADQVVVVVPPDPNSWQQLEVLTGRLKAVIRPERTRLTVVCNRPRRELQAAQTPGEADFDIPWFESLPPIGRWGGESLPVALADAATKLANQLGRTNQIGIYIPAQLGTGPLRDTGSYAQRAVAFLDKLFGSATGFPSFTVSDSESPDAAGEKIYRVQTYVTKTALDRHLGEVLEFVEKLKTELGQEAMALEVNRNIMLV